MCLAVYLAADRPLPLIMWNESARGFHVTELDGERDEPVRRQFTKPHVYYAGSHLICGCGFNYGQDPEAEDDPEELALKAKTLSDLSDYVARAVGDGETIQLFACWEVDQAAPPEHRRELTPEAFRSEGFVFEEKELIMVRRFVG
jgi:hypothetical protein